MVIDVFIIKNSSNEDQEAEFKELLSLFNYKGFNVQLLNHQIIGFDHFKNKIEDNYDEKLFLSFFDFVSKKKFINPIIFLQDNVVFNNVRNLNSKKEKSLWIYLKSLEAYKILKTQNKKNQIFELSFYNEECRNLKNISKKFNNEQDLKWSNSKNNFQVIMFGEEFLNYLSLLPENEKKLQLLSNFEKKNKIISFPSIFTFNPLYLKSEIDFNKLNSCLPVELVSQKKYNYTWLIILLVITLFLMIAFIFLILSPSKKFYLKQ